MKTRGWLALVFAAATLVAAEPDIELVGVLGVGQEFQAALKTKNGEPRWVTAGQQFGGFTMVRYEPKEETLVMTKDGRQFRLKLRESKVTAGAAELPPQLQKEITNNLRMLAAAADQYYLENGRSTVTYDDLVGPTKYVRAIEIKAGENYRAIEFAQGKTMHVTTSSGHAISYMP